MLFKILHGDKSRISTDITPYHEGYCYVTHDGDFYVDMNNERVKLNAKNAEMLCGMSYDDIKSYIDRAIGTKADTNHNHDDLYYTKSEIDDVIANTAESVIDTAAVQDAVVLHEAQTYTDSAVTNLQSSFDSVLDEAKSYTDEAMANVANASHNHDDRYYTEAEIDAKLDLKADFSTVSSNYNESIIGLSVDGNIVTYIKGDGSTHTFVTQDTDTTYSLATDEVTGLTKLYATTGNAEDGTMTQKAIKTELDKKVGVTIDDSSDTLIFTI